MEKIREVLQRCRTHSITLNPDKLFLAQEVKFVGHLVGKDGIKADPEKIAAIANFPTPKNITDLRSFAGLVTQLAAYHPHLRPIMAPLRGLLSPQKVWQWLDEHQLAFEATRKALSSTPILAHFDPQLPTQLWTDASLLNGLGYALVQDHGIGDEHTGE